MKSETPSTDNEVNGYAYPETPELVTSKFCRLLEKSLRKSIANKDERIAEIERENTRLTAGIKDVIDHHDFSSPETMLYRLRDLLPNV